MMKAVLRKTNGYITPCEACGGEVETHKTEPMDPSKGELIFICDLCYSTLIGGCMPPISQTLYNGNPFNVCSRHSLVKKAAQRRSKNSATKSEVRE